MLGDAFLGRRAESLPVTAWLGSVNSLPGWANFDQSALRGFRV